METFTHLKYVNNSIFPTPLTESDQFWNILALSYDISSRNLNLSYWFKLTLPNFYCEIVDMNFNFKFIVDFSPLGGKLELKVIRSVRKTKNANFIVMRIIALYAYALTRNKRFTKHQSSIKGHISEYIKIRRVI